MLPGPGQHFSFGALKPWEDILAMLDDNPGGQERGTFVSHTSSNPASLFLAGNRVWLAAHAR